MNLNKIFLPVGAVALTLIVSAFIAKSDVVETRAERADAELAMLAAHENLQNINEARRLYIAAIYPWEENRAAKFEALQTMLDQGIVSYEDIGMTESWIERQRRQELIGTVNMTAAKFMRGYEYPPASGLQSIALWMAEHDIEMSDLSFTTEDLILAIDSRYNDNSDVESMRSFVAMMEVQTVPTP